MTIEELKQLESQIEEKITKEYDEAKRGYNKGINQYKGVNQYYVSRSKEIIDFKYIDTFEELLDEVETAKEVIEQYKDKPGFHTDTQKEADENCIHTFAMNIYYKELITDEVLQKRIKSAVKNEVNSKLAPAGVRFARDVDCKLLQLFKDGVITWEALQKLVYSDCEI